MSAGAIGGASSLTSASSSGAFGELDSGEFIKILLSELTNQDPFEPQDSSAMLEQLSTLRNIESQLSLQDQLHDLVLQNQVSSAGGLIGKSVTGLDDNNFSIEGLVTSVRVQDGKAFLELDTGHTVSIDRVTRIADAQV